MCGPLPNASDRTNILDLVERMTELDGYLNQFEATLGQSAVTYYFRRRYMHARKMLIERGFAIDQMWRGCALGRTGSRQPTFTRALVSNVRDQSPAS